MIVCDSVGQTRRIWNMEHFPFNKNAGLKVWKFHVPNGTVHSGYTDWLIKPPCVSLMVIVLVSRIQKNGAGDNDFVTGFTQSRKSFNFKQSPWIPFFLEMSLNFYASPWKVLEFSSSVNVVAWKVFFDAFWLSKTEYEL